MRPEDVCMSCRVRLARNVPDLPFVSRMSQREAESFVNRVYAAFDGDSAYRLLRMMDVGDNDRIRLMEDHLASRELIVEPKGALILNKEKTISVMVNEEDHLRIQCILDGLDLERADQMARQTEERIGGVVDYAFDEKLGYLCACPTNVGTGMRASAMLHIPALARSGQAESVLLAAAKLGLAVRGFYGEGSAAPGHLYQISNQVTLGVLEEDIIQALTQTVTEIIEQEMSFREAALEQDRGGMVDVVSRSLGACRYAHRMGFAEFMEHCSNLKLGVSLGLITGLTQQEVNQLINAGQSAVLCANEGKLLSEEEETTARAKVARKALEEV